MKRRGLDAALTIVSVIYLVTFIGTLISYNIQQKDFDIFSIDGLSLIGAVFSLMELIASNRNIISKCIYKLIFFNKVVNYQVYVTFKTTTWDISKYVECLENSIEDYLTIELKRRPTSSLKSAKWSLFYENIGCEIECTKHENDFPFSEDSNNKIFGMKISGQGKYGRMSCRKKDIMYFSSLIKLLGNTYLSNPELIQNNTVNKIEIVIKRTGSQIKGRNIFNENMGKIEDYWIKIKEHLNNAEELEIDNNQIRWSTLDSRTLLDGFEDLTNFLCSVE